ncbi:hypothetical protein P171DRAFT_483651 [Karstenula rhodostoma CBS 690.94]|uniref:Ankyrin n=1 Tax=Karstenula rhodostoma CBS 690.94 TaxID=1392251 RepID=A0A9P4PNU0_9PLEO|nr:hypothetical protein P171DRAFT_483651 [Karstenula rhodostoma CBS 690.94]
MNSNSQGEVLHKRRRGRPRKSTAPTQNHRTVELSDLTLELLGLCLHHLMNDVGSAAAVKYRLVCKSFAFAIQKDLIHDQPIVNAFIGLNRLQKGRLLIRHGGKMHANKTGAAANAVTKLARQMMGELLIAGCIEPLPPNHLPLPGTGHGNETPLADFQNHRLWTSIAAIGDLQMFKKMVPTYANFFLGYGPYLPSAFRAAVGTGRVSIVEYILDQSPVRIRDSSGYSLRKLMCMFAVAVRLSVRQRQFRIATMIFQSFVDRMSVHEFIASRERALDIVLERILIAISSDERVGASHMTFLYYVLRAVRRGRWGESIRRSTFYILPQPNHKYDQIYKEASPSFIRAILTDIRIDIHDIRWFRPLRIALDSGRLDLAQIWLEHADFFESGYNKKTAMRRCVDRGDLAGVKFLVEHGVEPDLRLGDATALDIAMGHVKVQVQKKPYEGIISYLHDAIGSANRVQHVESSVDEYAGFLMDMIRELPGIEANWLFDRIRDGDDIVELGEKYLYYDFKPGKRAKSQTCIPTTWTVE